MKKVHVFGMVEQGDPKIAFAYGSSRKEAKDQLSQGGKGSKDYQYMGTADNADLEEMMRKLALENQRSANVVEFERV